MIEVILVILMVVAVIAISLAGRNSAKYEALAKGLENASKHKKAVSTVDGLHVSAKRDQLRKYSRKRLLSECEPNNSSGGGCSSDE